MCCDNRSRGSLYEYKVIASNNSMQAVTFSTVGTDNYFCILLIGSDMLYTCTL